MKNIRDLTVRAVNIERMMEDLSPADKVACITSVLLSVVVKNYDTGFTIIDNIAQKLSGQYAKLRELIKQRAEDEKSS